MSQYEIDRAMFAVGDPAFGETHWLRNEIVQAVRRCLRHDVDHDPTGVYQVSIQLMGVLREATR